MFDEEFVLSQTWLQLSIEYAPAKNKRCNISLKGGMRYYKKEETLLEKAKLCEMLEVAQTLKNQPSVGWASAMYIMAKSATPS